MALEESNNVNIETDTVTEVEGIHFLVADNQKYYFENVKLDYVKTMFNLGEYKLLRV